MLPLLSCLLLIGCGEKKETGDNGASDNGEVAAESVTTEGNEAPAPPESEIIGLWEEDLEKTLEALKSFPDNEETKTLKQFMLDEVADGDVGLFEFFAGGKVVGYFSDKPPEEMIYRIESNETESVTIRVQDHGFWELQGDTLRVIPRDGMPQMMECIQLSRVDPKNSKGRIEEAMRRIQDAQPRTAGNLNYTVSEGEATITGCSETLSGHLIIPSSIGGARVTNISNGAFSGRSSVTRALIPDGVERIGAGAFSRCKSLTEVSIPKSVISIGAHAFAHCTSLSGVEIPEGVRVLEPSTFDQCSNLKQAVIPAGVTEIGDECFESCLALEGIRMPVGIVSIGKNAFLGCQKLHEITLPEGVTKIGEAAFGGCTALTEVKVPGSMRDWGSYAFAYCHKLKSINLGEGITKIGAAAFYECTALTEIKIPASVTEIGASAFASCNNLTKAIFFGACPEEAGENPFHNAKPTIFRRQDAQGWAESFCGRPVEITPITP